MQDRRKFIKTTALAVPALGSLIGAREAQSRDDATSTRQPGNVRKPLVVSTWNHGLAANVAAWRVLERGGRALDAVEIGVKVSEADPKVQSVGYGGLPDRDGRVTLDASIMDASGRCGSVAFLQEIKHPISVARRVMEETPHVMLVGEGALQFALQSGFERQDLLTPEARAAWEKWLEESDAMPKVDAQRHDTIGMVAIDAQGDLSGSCTTSGLAYKMHGRVGDSPIIGAALYVDNEVGAACATGVGEAVIRTVGSFLIVELMRQGHTPEQACREAIARVVRRHPGDDDLQVGYLAMSRDGEIGSCSVRPGFQYAVHDTSGNELCDSSSWVEG
ncbi:MAG: N(4)-(beta-N-acetylglucosaminyl)-L-asparaginase [Candidatus Latescibacterota bacterium]|nr:MAG: N(4)-(beta-N-acetylglucosaminyl)-L-asparaginase [Candidatus Latescibacterota bacterium]